MATSTEGDVGTGVAGTPVCGGAWCGVCTVAVSVGAGKGGANIETNERK